MKTKKEKATKKKKTKVVIKLSDRIQALKRLERYKKDYKKYDEYRKKHGIVDSCIIDNFIVIPKVSPEGKKFCQKYKILYPFDPDQDIAVLPGSQFMPLEKGLHIPSIFPISSKIPKKKDVLGLKQGLMKSSNFPISLRIEKEEDIFRLEHGKYLHVAIDIDQKMATLTKDLRRLRRIYSRKVQEDERNRDSVVKNENNGASITMWDIYKMVHKEGKNLVQITREFFGVQGSPGYDFDEKFYKKINRAYQIAVKKIASFNASE